MGGLLFDFRVMTFVHWHCHIADWSSGMMPATIEVVIQHCGTPRFDSWISAFQSSLTSDDTLQAALFFVDSIPGCAIFSCSYWCTLYFIAG